MRAQLHKLMESDMAQIQTAITWLYSDTSHYVEESLLGNVSIQELSIMYITMSSKARIIKTLDDSEIAQEYAAYAPLQFFYLHTLHFCLN